MNSNSVSDITYNSPMQNKLPNLLTWFRIIMIPLMVIVFLSDLEYARPISGVIFAIAGWTDMLDGYLARKWNVMSKFGAFLDPVADKLLVSTALILVVSDAHPDWSIWIIEWMAGEGRSDMVKVQKIGKLKTIFQMGAIFALLYQVPLLKLPTYAIGFLSLIIAAFFTVLSMVIYLRSAWSVMKE